MYSIWPSVFHAQQTAEVGPCEEGREILVGPDFSGKLGIGIERLTQQQSERKNLGRLYSRMVCFGRPNESPRI